MAPIEDVGGTTRATTLAKPASLMSRAYVTFLDGNSECVKGVVGLAKGLRKVKTAYPLVVAVLPDVPEEHRRMLVAQGCIVREIEPVYVPKNQTQFAMADYVINYSKLRIWEFVEYYKMIYLDGDTLVFENIDHLFDMPNGYFYAVNDCFCEKTWSHTPQYQIGYCQQCPDKVQWPAELGPKPPLYFNAGMFVFEPSLSIYDDLLNTLKGTHPTPFAEQDFLNMFFKDVYKPIPPIYNLVLAMLWRHPEKLEVDKVKVVHYCASPITLLPALKDRQFTNADMAMESTFSLLFGAAHLAKQSDIAVFSHALHFSLVVEKIKELEFRAVDAEGKAAHAERKLQSMDLMLKSSEQERKLQSMDLMLKSSEQEIGSLKAEKEQLANALATSKGSLACAIEAAKHEGCNEATAVYAVQFAKLENMLFEDGWTLALDEANVPADSDLRKNVPYPRPEIAGRENDVADGAEAIILGDTLAK